MLMPCLMMAGVIFPLIYANISGSFAKTIGNIAVDVVSPNPSIQFIHKINSTETSQLNKKLLINDVSYSQQSPKNDQGKLLVIVKIVDKAAQLTSSDVKVTIHSNDPIPSSFRGNSSGTWVKLHMGMYSATASGPAGYIPFFSGDCSGGMMSVEMKKCLITYRPR